MIDFSETIDYDAPRQSDLIGENSHREESTLANRRADRQAHKRRRNAIRRQISIPWLYAAILDDEEMRFFFAQKRFDWLVREVKRQLYRRPQGINRRYARQRPAQTDPAH